MFLEIGTRVPADVATYSDIDMKVAAADGQYVHKDGSPYRLVE